MRGIGWAALMAIGATTFAGLRAASAGCSDGACGRIDWTEITETSGTEAVAAKLHGRFAWESSEGWIDHVVGGSLRGFLWMKCAPTDRACKLALAAEVRKTGSSDPLYFRGNFWDYQTSKPMQPPLLFAEGQTGTAAGLDDLNLGIEPWNPSVCPTAFALAPNPPPDVVDPGMGGADQMTACSAAPGRPSGAFGSWLLAAALLLARRRG